MTARLLNAVLLAGVILIASCRPAAAGPIRDKVFTASEWAVFTAHALDASTTMHCLGAGRCTEANPWLARYESPIAFTGAKFGVGLVQVYLTRKLYRAGHPRLATATNWIVAGAFTSIAIRNQRIGR